MRFLLTHLSLSFSLSLSLSQLTLNQCVCDKVSREDFDEISIRINGVECISISFSFYFCFLFLSPDEISVKKSYHVIDNCSTSFIRRDIRITILKE